MKYLLLICLLCAPSAQAQVKLWDQKNILSPIQQSKIKDYLAFVRKTYNIDYRVYLISTDGSDLLMAGAKYFAEQKVGQSNKGQGLLLVIDHKQKKSRVEVGYALEPYITDGKASSWLEDYLRPYYQSKQLGNGVEASIEGLINLIKPKLKGMAQEADLGTKGSGGAGATKSLLGDVKEGALTEETKVALKKAMVPQPTPAQAQQLVLAMMHKGYYYREVSIYDEQWQKAKRPVQFTPERLKAIARDWDQKFEVLEEGPLAISYYTQTKKLGPTFYRKTPAGWILDITQVNKNIIYDYSNDGWYALDGSYPFLAMMKKVYKLKPIKLKSGRKAWMINSAARK